MSKRVIEFKEKDLQWQFDKPTPLVTIGGRDRGWKSNVYMDPTPAYPHDVKLTRQELHNLEIRMLSKGLELDHKPYFYIVPREIVERTQAWAERSIYYYKEDGSSYEDGEPREWEGQVVLSAKRTPIHPAVTKYLVGHEYGHHASWKAMRTAGRANRPDDVYDWYNHYARKVRDLSKSWDAHKYGPGLWHKDPGEVMANDFRILIGEIDSDFWPHPCKHPSEVPKLVDWWKEHLSGT